MTTRASEPLNDAFRKPPSLSMYVAASLVVSILVITLATVAVVRENERYRERATIDTQNIAVLLEHHVGNIFDKINVLLLSEVAYFLEISDSRKTNTEALNRHITDQVRLIPELDGLRILDAKGFVRFGNDIPTAPLADASDRDYYLQARDNPNEGLIISGPVLSRITQKWVIVLAHRITRPDGSFGGVVYASMATRYFEHILSSPVVGKHGATTIRTSDLALVHRYPETKNAVGSRDVSKQLSSAIQQAPDGGDYIATTALDGIERSNSYRKLEHYPFYVIVGLAVDDYLGGWKQIIRIISGLAGLTILVTCLGATLIYRYHRRLSADIVERMRISEALEHAIAERTRLNAALEIRAQEAEAANRAKTAFLNTVSHELLTPMNGIIGMTGLALRRATDPKQQDQLAKVTQSSDRLLAIINNILAYAETESKKFTLDKVDFTLQSLVDGIAAQYAPMARDKGLNFTMDIDAEVANTWLHGEAEHVGLILGHLVGNAIKFTATGGVIVGTRLVQEGPSDVLIRFEVTDTGIGISEEEQTRLFNVFEQIDGSLSRRYGGIGLGLALCKRLTEAMGGAMGLNSVQGQGSTFWLTARLQRTA